MCVESFHLFGQIVRCTLRRLQYKIYNIEPLAQDSRLAPLHRCPGIHWTNLLYINMYSSSLSPPPILQRHRYSPHPPRRQTHGVQAYLHVFDFSRQAVSSSLMRNILFPSIRRLSLSHKGCTQINSGHF